MIDYNEIGIGILDTYDDKSLLGCISRFSEITKDTNTSFYIVTNRKTPTKGFTYDETFFHQVSMATLRNACIRHFRKIGKRYIFLVTSDVIITDSNFIQTVINTAENFGTWLLTGNVDNPTIIDDETGSSLSINTKIEPNFIFLRSGIVNNVGYFDERYFNTSYLDALDYIERARKLNIFPPSNYFATVGNIYTTTKADMDRIDHSNILSKDNRSVGLSFGYFRHVHGYVPTIDDIKSVSKDELMKYLEELQEAYSKK